MNSGFDKIGKKKTKNQQPLPDGGSGTEGDPNTSGFESGSQVIGTGDKLPSSGNGSQIIPEKDIIYCRDPSLLEETGFQLRSMIQHHNFLDIKAVMKR